MRPTQRVSRERAGRTRGYGWKIINVASVAGFKGTGVFPSYAISKGGLLQLTRCLAIELAPHRIQVNSLALGWTTTDMTAWTRTEPQYAELYKEMVTRTPAGALCRPGGGLPERQYFSPRLHRTS